jgi:error-prone DNA polymerase
VPVSSLVELADADAMKEALGLARRQALWAIKALRDEPLELWTAAAEREAGTVPELDEPDVAIRPMTAGGEVVEDYRHVGLSLRRHPVEFLRADLTGRRIVTCAEAMAATDGRWLEAAGLVLVRQRPGSAKGRHVHNYRGRDRRRKPGGLALGVRAPAADRALGGHDVGPR